MSLDIYALHSFIDSGKYWWEQIIFCLFTTSQPFWQSSAPGALNTLVTSVVLYWLTWATMMSPGKVKTRVCGYICSEFIHWALWRTLMGTEYFLFIHYTTRILVKFSTCCFEHSGDISSSLLVNLIHTDESLGGRNMCLWIYTLWIYSLSTLENTIFFVHSPHHKYFGKAQHLVLWALWWHQLFSTHWPEPHWWVLRRTKHVCWYIRSEFIHWAPWEHGWEQNIFCLLTTPQAFWQASARGDLSTLMTSVVLYSLT